MIKLIRCALKETQSVFGKRYKVTQSLVSYWENEEDSRLPKASIAKKIKIDAAKAGIKKDKYGQVDLNPPGKGFSDITLDDIYA